MRLSRWPRSGRVITDVEFGVEQGVVSSTFGVDASTRGGVAWMSRENHKTGQRKPFATYLSGRAPQ